MFKYKTSNLPSSASGKYTLPALTAGIQNQGLNNYVPREEGTTILSNVISISANGANTGATFYQPHEFCVLQDAYAINWKDTTQKLSPQIYFFLTSAISSVVYGKYKWTNKGIWSQYTFLYVVACFRKAGFGLFDYGNKFNCAIAAQMNISFPRHAKR